MGKINSLSVFFPAYNEEENIRKTIEAALAILPQLAKKWEIIVVIDGSTDKTPQIVQKLIERDKRIRKIVHEKNCGYGTTLKDGFYNCRYEWIVFTDADGQFDFSEIRKFLEVQEKTNADLIAGYRLNRQDSLIRKLFGKGWTFLANLLLKIKVKDVDCGFKLVRKRVLETIPRLESTRGGMISPELLAKARSAGFKIAEVGICHYPRKAGKSSGADLKVIFTSFFDLAKLWWRLR